MENIDNKIINKSEEKNDTKIKNDEKVNEKNGIDLRDGYVPCTTLFLKRMSDNKNMWFYKY